MSCGLVFQAEAKVGLPLSEGDPPTSCHGVCVSEYKDHKPTLTHEGP